MISVRKKNEKQKMDESQLAGGIAFCRVVLNQPELRLDDICKAHVVNRIIADFDKRPTMKQCEANPNNDILLAIRNYEVVIQNIVHYYRHVLNQVIVRTLPNGLTIVRAGHSNLGLTELDVLLNLVINAAVSSEGKAVYINHIKSFDHLYQSEIAGRITTTEEYLVDLLVPEVNYSNSRTIENYLQALLKHLSKVCLDRDDSQRKLNETLQQRDQIVQNSMPLDKSKKDAAVNQDTYTELAEAKQRIRMLRQDITDKEELAELSHNEMELAKERELNLMEEIQKLRSELTNVRTNQDEIDELRTKSDQLQHAQQETTRLRERLSDFDFFKTRVDELQKENSSLYDARAALETEIAANRIRLIGMLDQAEHNERLRAQVQDLEEQNLELHQAVQQLQEQVKCINLDYTLDSVHDSHNSSQLNQSIGTEIDGTHVPENLRLKNEIKRMVTINAAMLEQQNQQRNNVSDLERQLNRSKEENARLQNQLLLEKTHAMDIESFAKEQLDGKDIDTIFNQLKEKETDERLEIEVKVWEARVQDASEKIEKLEQEFENTHCELSGEIERLKYENMEMRKNFETEKRGTDKERLTREEKIREIERKLRESERSLENFHIENEQRILDKEQHVRTEQRRLQLETEIDHLRRQVEYNQEILETRNNEIENLERTLGKARGNSRNLESEIRQLREVDENLTKTDGDVLKLENDKRQLEAKLKQSLHREEKLDRERKLVLTESVNAKEHIKVMEAEKTERSRIISVLRSSNEKNTQQLRDHEVQLSTFGKLKQQLVDEKIFSQNLEVEMKAAKIRLKKLDQVHEEKEELSRQVEAMKHEINSRIIQHGDERDKLVDELQKTLETKTSEINDLNAKIHQSEQNDTRIFKADLDNELKSYKEKLIEIQIQRDELLEIQSSHQVRLQEENTIYDEKIDRFQRESLILTKEKVVAEQQFQGLKTIHDKLSGDMETILSDRDEMRRETRHLRREIHEAQKFVDQLQKEKREMSKAMDNLVKQKNQMDTSQTSSYYEQMEDINRLRDSNSQLTVSYGKLKADYGQMLEDTRSLKHKSNAYNVERVKFETKVKQMQEEAWDYDRELQDISTRYELLSELKEKISQENDYLQKQNDHLMSENEELNRSSLNTKDSYNHDMRQYEKDLAALRRQKERVEEKMMAQYKSPSPPKKPKGLFNKLKESLTVKKETRKNRKPEIIVTHVPLKSDVDSDNSSFPNRHSDWSRPSSFDDRPRTPSTDEQSRSLQSDETHEGEYDEEVATINMTPANNPKKTDCITLQQFLSESNKMESKDTKSFLTKTPSIQSDEKSIRSASSAEIRILMTANGRSTPKPDYILANQHLTSPPTQEYDLHSHYFETKVPAEYHKQSRTAYQSPLSTTYPNSQINRNESAYYVTNSQETNPNMDRLTASRSMFERDKFAESLAKLNLKQKRLFSDPRQTQSNTQNGDSMASRYF